MDKNIFLLIIIILLLVKLLLNNKDLIYETFTDISQEEDSIPNVGFPFRNLIDDNGKKLNIILITAPFREKKDEDNWIKYKSMGLDFCGISSYLEFPGKISNPHDDFYHEERRHDYVKMVSAWMHIFRKPPQNLIDAKIPLLLMAEADLLDVSGNDHYHDDKIEKEYDFIYINLDDNDECTPGWNWYNRNWDLAKKCLEVICEKHNLKGAIVGRKNCKFTDKCDGIIKIIPYLEYHEFQKELQKAKFLFMPNIADASPRTITQAMGHNIPVLVNYNILGGWNNVISGVTGELFTSEDDISPAIYKLINNYNNYTPRKWFVENKGKDNCCPILAKFLIDNFPNINNKTMKFAQIS